MPLKPTGNPTGRPPKIIDQKQFEALCGIQCTEEEVLAVLDCDKNTLNKWCRSVYGGTFSQVYKEKSANGKASLRRTQWKLAEKNAAMAIWLGKQYLGQKDSLDVKAESEANDRVTMTINFKDFKDGD